MLFRSGSTHLVTVNDGLAVIGGMVDNLETIGPGLGRVEAGGSVQQIIMSNGTTNRVWGGFQPAGKILGDSAAHCFLYGTNWTSKQTATNVTTGGGTFDIFRITGLTADGTFVKDLDFYRKVGSGAAVHLVNTNISYPALAITQAGPGSVALSWHHPSTGYVLQSTTNLSAAGPSVWVAVPTPPTLSGSNKVVMVNSTNAQAFYHLISQ